MTAHSTRTLANHIGGAWTPSAATQTLPDRDPATGELVAQVPLSTAADVDAAVRAARAAQREWRATSPLVRARAVMELRAVLDAHRDELAAARLRTRAGDDPATDVCPLVSPAARERLLGELDRAEADGATVVLDGRGDPGPPARSRRRSSTTCPPGTASPRRISSGPCSRWCARPTSTPRSSSSTRAAAATRR